MCAVVVFGMLMGLSGTRVEEFKEGVVERALVFAVRFLHRLEERLGEVPVVATLHRAQVSPELFVAIEHVDVPVLIAGNDVGQSHGSISAWLKELIVTDSACLVGVVLTEMHLNIGILEAGHEDVSVPVLFEVGPVTALVAVGGEVLAPGQSPELAQDFLVDADPAVHGVGVVVEGDSFHGSIR